MKKIEYVNNKGFIIGYRFDDGIKHYNFISMFDNHDDIVVNDNDWNEYLNYCRQYSKLSWLVHGFNKRYPG